MEMNGLSETRRSNVVQGFNGDGLHNSLGDCDPWTAWAYKPCTISLLLIGTCLLIGVWAMIAVFLAYSLLQARSTVLIRPHPVIWRLVHGMAVVYLVAFTFLLFQVIVARGAHLFFTYAPCRNPVCSHLSCVGKRGRDKFMFWCCSKYPP